MKYDLSTRPRDPIFVLILVAKPYISYTKRVRNLQHLCMRLQGKLFTQSFVVAFPENVTRPFIIDMIFYLETFGPT